MKPWEETWRTGLRWFDGLEGRHEYGWGITTPRDGNTPSEIVVRFRLPVDVSDATAREIQRFHEAAPDMARALLGMLLHHGHIDDCPGRLGVGSPCYTRCEHVRAALAKAGVPLP